MAEKKPTCAFKKPTANTIWLKLESISPKPEFGAYISFLLAKFSANSKKNFWAEKCPSGHPVWTLLRQDICSYIRAKVTLKLPSKFFQNHLVSAGLALGEAASSGFRLSRLSA